jgi:hypothetical protein
LFCYVAQAGRELAILLHCLPSVGIIGMHHHAQLDTLLNSCICHSLYQYLTLE